MVLILTAPVNRKQTQHRFFWLIKIAIMLLSPGTGIEFVWPYLSTDPCYQQFMPARHKSASQCTCFSDVLFTAPVVCIPMYLFLGRPVHSRYLLELVLLYFFVAHSIYFGIIPQLENFQFWLELFWLVSTFLFLNHIIYQKSLVIFFFAGQYLYYILTIRLFVSVIMFKTSEFLDFFSQPAL